MNQDDIVIHPWRSQTDGVAAIRSLFWSDRSGLKKYSVLALSLDEAEAADQMIVNQISRILNKQRNAYTKTKKTSKRANSKRN